MFGIRPAKIWLIIFSALMVISFLMLSVGIAASSSPLIGLGFLWFCIGLCGVIISSEVLYNWL